MTIISWLALFVATVATDSAVCVATVTMDSAVFVATVATDSGVFIATVSTDSAVFVATLPVSERFLVVFAILVQVLVRFVASSNRLRRGLFYRITTMFC